jgi:SPP1 gp7 family putative phage head morphogenesis protein
VRNKLYSYLSEISSPLRGVKGTNYLKKSFDRCASLEQQRRDPSDLLNKKNTDVRFYDTMMLDDTISGTHELLKQVVLSVNGAVEPVDDSPAAAEQAEFHNDWLYQLTPNIWDAMDNALDAKIYGYKCAEIIWGTDINKWVPSQFKFKHSYLFDFDYDEYGNLNEVLIAYYVGNDGKLVGEDISKKILMMIWPYAKDGNYYGSSILDSIYLQYYQKYNIERYWATYLQNFGMPIIEIKYDSDNLKSDEKDDLKDMAENWQDQMWFLTPGKRNKQTGELKGKFELVMHEVKATSTDAYEKNIRYLDQCIKRKMLLPDNVGYTTTDTGSYAKSQTELSVFEKVVRYHHGKLEDWLNPLIRQVHIYNFGEQDVYPEWKFEEIDKNLTDTMLSTLITTGIVDPAEKWVRNYIGIPSLTEQEQADIDEKKKERGSIGNAIDTPAYNDDGSTSLIKSDTEQSDALGGATNVQATALNGAQVQALLMLIQEVADKQLPIETGKTIVQAAFPLIDPELINKMFASIKSFKPAPIETPAVAQEVKKPIDKPEEMKAGKVPFDAEKAKKEFSALENEFVDEYGKIMDINSERIVKFIRKNYDPTKKDYKWIEALSLTTMLKKLYAIYLSKVYVQGVGDALQETIKRANKSIKHKMLSELHEYQLTDEDEWLDKDYIKKHLKEYGSLGALTREQAATLRGLKQKAGLASADDEARILKNISLALRKAIDTSKPLQDVVPTIEALLRDDRKQYALTIARTNQSTSYNAGRMDTFRSDAVRPYIEAYQYQAIMDDVTTDFCREHDGQIIKADDPDLQRINPPNHFNCRSILVPIFITDTNETGSYFNDYENKFDKWGTGVTDAGRNPAEGFN